MFAMSENAKITSREYFPPLGYLKMYISAKMTAKFHFESRNV